MLLILLALVGRDDEGIRMAYYAPILQFYHKQCFKHHENTEMYSLAVLCQPPRACSTVRTLINYGIQTFLTS